MTELRQRMLDELQRRNFAPFATTSAPFVTSRCTSISRLTNWGPNSFDSFNCTCYGTGSWQPVLSRTA